MIGSLWSIGSGSLGERYALTPKARGQLATLLWTLAADPLAPTTVTDPRRALEDHVADSLVALELEAASAAVEIADLGAGAGFPGLRFGDRPAPGPREPGREQQP